MAKSIRERNWPENKVLFFEKHNIRPVRPMRIPRKSLERKIAFYQKHNVAYWLEYTNERTTVFAAGTWGSHMNKESAFKSNELQFIKQVKEYILNNETYKLIKNKFQNEQDQQKIKYAIYTNKVKPGTIFYDCLEVDLKGAYWEQLRALHKDLISEAIYKKGQTVEKKTRLAAVGTVNKTTGIVTFDGTKEGLQDPIKSEKTGFLWHTISHKIGQVMVKASKEAKADFIFAWVDALFIHGDKVKEIIQLFNSAGFKSSVHKCEWIRFDDRKIVVHSKEKGKFLTKTTRERITLPSGKKAVKLIRKKVWTEERPFPYKKIMTKKQIEELKSYDNAGKNKN